MRQHQPQHDKQKQKQNYVQNLYQDLQLHLSSQHTRKPEHTKQTCRTNPQITFLSSSFRFQSGFKNGVGVSILQQTQSNSPNDVCQTSSFRFKTNRVVNNKNHRSQHRSNAGGQICSRSHSSRTIICNMGFIFRGHHQIR